MPLELNCGFGLHDQPFNAASGSVILTESSKKPLMHATDANLGMPTFSTCGFASRPYKMPVMNETIPQLFDPLAQRQNRQRAAATYANFAFLKDEAASVSYTHLTLPTILLV